MIRHELIDLPDNKVGLAIPCQDVVGEFWLGNTRFYIEEIFRELFKKYRCEPVAQHQNPLGGQNLLDIRLVTKYNIRSKIHEEDVFTVEIIPPEEPD